jgi:glycosyltransferase involved in cell wall biosynthesis
MPAGSTVGLKRLICFRKKTRRQPWILEFLWRDISRTNYMRSRGDVELFFVHDIDVLRRLMNGVDAYVLVFDSQLAFLRNAGFPLGRIILYFPHVRAGCPLPGLKELHAVLCLNSFERNLCLQEGVAPERIHLFPAGYSASLFNMRSSVPLSDRENDVLFVCRYVVRDWRGPYPSRKRYEFLCGLANALSLSGYRVVILGPGWGDCEYPLVPEVRRVESPHLCYPGHYRGAKLVCSVSGQEGGPVFFLEGLASGCAMVSTPSGFAFEFCSGKDGVWILPLSWDIHQWVEQIDACLNQLPQCLDSVTRRDFLQKAEFEALASQLLQICFQSE